MPESVEFETQFEPLVEAGEAEDVVTLGPDDFQRIGLRPAETRLDVIRRASSRATKTLARKQLNAPNRLTEQQLTLIAVSTYRLLDPRQRGDRRSRAHVGRIRPGALFRAGRAEFANGNLLIQSCSSSEACASTHHLEDIQLRTIASQSESLPAASFAPEPEKTTIDVCSITPWVNARPSRWSQMRQWAARPQGIVTMMILLIMAAIALWYWGQNLPETPPRY